MKRRAVTRTGCCTGVWWVAVEAGRLRTRYARGTTTNLSPSKAMLVLVLCFCTSPSSPPLKRRSLPLPPRLQQDSCQSTHPVSCCKTFLQCRAHPLRPRRHLPPHIATSAHSAPRLAIRTLHDSHAKPHTPSPPPVANPHAPRRAYLPPHTLSRGLARAPRSRRGMPGCVPAPGSRRVRRGRPRRPYFSTMHVHV